MRTQPSFATIPGFSLAARREHGHEIRRGQRKTARPFDRRIPMHVVFRSERAKGSWSFLNQRNDRRVKHIIYDVARRTHVRIYKFANAGNHLHLLIRSRNKQDAQKFLRMVGGLIARAVTAAKKGNPVGKFWDSLVYSRLVSWGREFFAVKDYIEINEMEAQEVWSRKLVKLARAQRPRPRRE